MVERSAVVSVPPSHVAGSKVGLLGFPLQVPQAEVSEATLVMQVYDFNRFAKHDIIGEVRLPLASVSLQHIIEQWSDLVVASKVEVGPSRLDTPWWGGGGMWYCFSFHHLTLRGSSGSPPC